MVDWATLIDLELELQFGIVLFVSYSSDPPP